MSCPHELFRRVVANGPFPGVDIVPFVVERGQIPVDELSFKYLEIHPQRIYHHIPHLEIVVNDGVPVSFIEFNENLIKYY